MGSKPDELRQLRDDVEALRAMLGAAREHETDERFMNAMLDVLGERLARIAELERAR